MSNVYYLCSILLTPYAQTFYQIWQLDKILELNLLSSKIKTEILIASLQMIIYSYIDFYIEFK